MFDYRMDVYRTCFQAVYGNEGKEDFSQEDFEVFADVFCFVLGCELSDRLVEVYVYRTHCLEDNQIEKVINDDLKKNEDKINQPTIRKRASRIKNDLPKRMKEIYEDPSLLKQVRREFKFVGQFSSYLENKIGGSLG